MSKAILVENSWNETQIPGLTILAGDHGEPQRVSVYGNISIEIIESELRRFGAQLRDCYGGCWDAAEGEGESVAALEPLDPTEFFYIVSSIGEGATEEELAVYCVAAEAWLTEHEGDDLSIMVRPTRRGEGLGLFHLRGGVPDGREIGSTPDDAIERRARDLIAQVWQLFCNNELPGIER